MPGSSLWLIPPATHPLNTLISQLIRQTSEHFSSPHLFIPHLTLTSEISPSLYDADPQAWLDSLKLPPGSSVQIKFEKLNSEPVFVRKLYIKCVKNDGIRKLAVACRQLVAGYGEADGGKAEKWAAEIYNPHVSLLYHDCPPVDEQNLTKIGNLVRKTGVTMGQDASATMGEDGELGGWQGGRIVLVPTDKLIAEWEPIAEKIL